MVEEIVELEPQLNARGLCNLGVLIKGKVEVVQPRTMEKVAPSVPIDSLGFSREVVRIEEIMVLGSRTTLDGVDEFASAGINQRYSTQHVRAVRATIETEGEVAGEGTETAIRQGDGESGLEGGDPRDLPTISQTAGETFEGVEFTDARQIVKIAECEPVPRVEGRIAISRMEVEGVRDALRVLKTRTDIE